MPLKYSIENGNASVIGFEDGPPTGYLEIPSTISGSPVASIGAGAFYGFSDLASVGIPTGITSIGDYAFFGCGGLTGVKIPSGVTDINYRAFNGCSLLTGIYFLGDAPGLGRSDMFVGVPNGTIYYLAQSSGWAPFYGRLYTMTGNFT